MRFDDNFLEQLKSKNDIVEVVSSYCNLVRKGGSYWACCPLPGHLEKAPSFSVNPSGQFFKCFGCQRGGNVIKFIMEVESLDFFEAVKFLCNRSGMELPSFNNYDLEKTAEKKRKKERLLAILKSAAHFYVDNLRLDKAEKYRNYLEKRGFDNAVSRAFGIGASLDYQSLPKHLKELGYSFEEMFEAGVVGYNKERNSYYDFQAERLIIPIIDAMNNVIAFGGRVLQANPGFAKYKNTSETELYIKNKCLFNINNLKKEKRIGFDYVIMVEGYMDAISLYSAGFHNVVASMGTSLTQDQAKMLKRYTDKVVISYDGDSAGQKATIRGLEILRDAGLTVKIISIPDGMDPDDMIQKKGKDAYLALIDQALLLIDYKLAVLKRQFDVTTVEGKRKFIDGALSVIKECDKSFEQEELLIQLSKMSGIAYDYLRRDFEKKPQNVKKQIEEEKEVKAVSSLVLAERFVLYAFLCPTKFSKVNVDVDDIVDLEFSDATRTDICNYIIKSLDGGNQINPAVLPEILKEEQLAELDLILNSGEGVFGFSDEQKYYRDCLNTIKQYCLENNIKQLEEMAINEPLTENRKRIISLIQNANDELMKIRNGGLK